MQTKQGLGSCKRKSIVARGTLGEQPLEIQPRSLKIARDSIQSTQGASSDTFHVHAQFLLEGFRLTFTWTVQPRFAEASTSINAGPESWTDQIEGRSGFADRRAGELLEMFRRQQDGRVRRLAVGQLTRKLEKAFTVWRERILRRFRCASG